MFFFVILLPLLFTLIYWKLRSNRQYWTRKGVKQINGFVLGDNWDTVLGKQSFTEMVLKAYNMFPNTRFSGFYMFLSPILILKDPELIKQITVKDFDHFVNHKSVIPEGGDPLFNKILFFLKNKKWHDMRTTMSPAFTSSKMKYMFSLICQNGRQFAENFLEKNQEIITVDLKEIFTRFACDVIGNVAFGVEIDSFKNPDNEFYLKGKSLTDFRGIVKMLKFFGTFLCSPLYKFFKISLFSKTEVDFFSNIIIDNIRSREKYGIVRPDMITMLLQARKNLMKTKIEISDQDIVSQEIAFFFGGFESVSSLLCFMSYELGIKPDIQKKVIEEVDKTADACSGQLTYEALFGMKYMDMVVSEALRKWPNIVTTDRVCTHPYTINPENPNQIAIQLETNTHVWIPIFALHRDPRYFPDPEKFDPERFNDENKEKIIPYTYLPFGAGPRNCLGSRLVLLETKILFFFLLSHFEIVPVEKTQIPLKISKKDLNLSAEGGFWFGLKRRVK